MSFITINEALIQIREDSGNTEAIKYLNQVIPVAEAHLFNRINRYASGFTTTTGSTLEVLPEDLKHAILYIIADLNEFRESKNRYNVYKVPDTLDSMLSFYINYGDKY